jgi:hypothetical protein
MIEINNDTRVCEAHQLGLTAWLRKELCVEDDFPIYFDDATLCLESDGVAVDALVSPHLTAGQLLDKVLAEIQYTMDWSGYKFETNEGDEE